MATHLAATLRIALLAVQRNLGELSTPVDRVSVTERFVFEDGEGANQAEEVWHDERTIAFGQTDEIGYYGIEDVVHVHDLHATVLHLLGLDHLRLTYRFQGRNFRLTDVAGNVVYKILA